MIAFSVGALIVCFSLFAGTDAAEATQSDSLEDMSVASALQEAWTVWPRPSKLSCEQLVALDEVAAAAVSGSPADRAPLQSSGKPTPTRAYLQE